MEGMSLKNVYAAVLFDEHECGDDAFLCNDFVKMNELEECTFCHDFCDENECVADVFNTCVHFCVDVSMQYCDKTIIEEFIGT